MSQGDVINLLKKEIVTDIDELERKLKLNRRGILRTITRLEEEGDIIIIKSVRRYYLINYDRFFNND